MLQFYSFIGTLDYVFISAVALWGLYCAILIVSRVSTKRFKSEDAQDAFLDSIEPSLLRGDFDAVLQACEGNEKALPMMVQLALNNRELGYQKVRQFVMDRFQRDVLADLDNRVAWIATCIKTAPMLGLFGTVLGMLGAFGNLEAASNADPNALAGDIRMALEHTAMGLLVAIPLILVLATVTNRIREMEQLVAAGLTRFMDAMKAGLAKNSGTARARS
ncbi:MAG: MotA/TolQ/ExbB proton channel family protein [Pirellulales bacterium]